jgi:hypothetical protein
VPFGDEDDVNVDEGVVEGFFVTVVVMVTVFSSPVIGGSSGGLRQWLSNWWHFYSRDASSKTPTMTVLLWLSVTVKVVALDNVEY